MSISKNFEASVENESIDVVRSILINSLITDRTFNKFDEELEYAKNKFNDIIESDEEAELNQDKTTWNDSYCGLVSFELLSNFSLKRINHLKEVLIEIHGEPVVVNTQDKLAKTEVEKTKEIVKSAYELGCEIVKDDIIPKVQKFSEDFKNTYPKTQVNAEHFINIKNSYYDDFLNVFTKKYPNLEKEQISIIIQKHFKNIDVELERLSSDLKDN